MGCANPEGATGWNIARQVALRAGMPVSVSGMTVNRFCSSGLQTVALAAQRILTGEGDIFVAGGVESISCVQNEMNQHMFVEDWLKEHKPAVYMPMLQTAENVAKRYKISREDQDRFGVQSQNRAFAAREAGKFNDEIVPITVTMKVVDKNTGAETLREITASQDEGIRGDTTYEGVSQIRPAVDGGEGVFAGRQWSGETEAALGVRHCEVGMIEDAEVVHHPRINIHSASDEQLRRGEGVFHVVFLAHHPAELPVWIVRGHHLNSHGAGPNTVPNDRLADLHGTDVRLKLVVLCMHDHRFGEGVVILLGQTGLHVNHHIGQSAIGRNAVEPGFHRGVGAGGENGRRQWDVVLRRWGAAEANSALNEHGLVIRG